MQRTAFIVLAAALGAAAAAPALAAPARGDQCFLASDMTNWRAVGDKQVNVEVRNREVYRLDLANSCPELRFAGETIAVQGARGEFICESSLAEIRVPGQGIGSCPVTHITHLTREQVQSLPKKERP